MIEVTVTLKPSSGGEPKHLGTAIIINDGSGDYTTGNYTAVFSKWGNPNQAWKKSQVKNFRRQQRGSWDLLYLALKEAVGARNR